MLKLLWATDWVVEVQLATGVAKSHVTMTGRVVVVMVVVVMVNGVQVEVPPWQCIELRLWVQRSGESR